MIEEVRGVAIGYFWLSLPEGRIDFESGDGHRKDLVTRLEGFDRNTPSGRHMDECAKEEAVGAGRPAA